MVRQSSALGFGTGQCGVETGECDEGTAFGPRAPGFASGPFCFKRGPEMHGPDCVQSHY